MALPPGFRFHPTDEELVVYYLKRKVAGRTVEFNIITEVDLYKQEPWDLPEKSYLPGSDMEWYFFSPRDKKYPNGLRANRATVAGYWKATGKDRTVKKAGRPVGMKKTLVFYTGRAPHGERTDWVMHEYRLDEEECEKMHASQDLFVLCRVFKKSGVGPRSGEDRGPATYVDDDVDREPSASFMEVLKKSLGPEPGPSPAPSAPKAGANCDTVDAVKVISVSAPTISVEDYTAVEESKDVIGVASEVTLDDYLLDEPSFPQSEDDLQFWDCLPSLAGGVDFPSANEVRGAQHASLSELFGAWPGERETGLSGGMMWNSDLGSSVPQPQHVQQNVHNGGPVELDMLEGDLLDDLLPALEEEKESSAMFPSQARDESTSADVAGSAPTGASLNHFDSSQLPPCSSDLVAPASAAGLGNSGLPSSQDNLISFQDSFYDFPLDEELFNMASDYDETEFSPTAPPQLVVDQGNSEVNVPQPDKPVKYSQSSRPEGPARFSSKPLEGSSKATKSESKPLAGLMKLLGSMPALPASAAECAPDMKPFQPSGEIASSFSSIHVSAVTVTCTSSADGVQKVEAAVTDCRVQGDANGVYQQVVSGSWQTQGSDALKPVCENCDTASGSVGLQRRVARGANSGFVFVFVLGAVSALCWFLLIRTMWRVASHVLTSVF